MMDEKARWAVIDELVRSAKMFRKVSALVRVHATFSSAEQSQLDAQEEKLLDMALDMALGRGG